jgi:2-oxoglutarate dehydrogenase E1 component
MTGSDHLRPGFGPNAWLVEETYQRYLADPDSVGEAWQELFSGYQPPGVLANGAVPNGGGPEPVMAVPGSTGAGEHRADPPVRPLPAEAAPVSAPAGDGAVRPLRGGAGRIVANMEASLGVPTATSVRPVPAKLLEVNRTILNNHLARASGGKVSFTHLIGYAVVRAAAELPAMRRTYVADVDGKGTPGAFEHEHVGLGLAVDVERADGTRSLLVPCVKDADTLDFAAFVASYEQLIGKVRTGKVAPDDFEGTVITLTNPGTLGTVHSVPRLMPGQAVIVGVGAISYPAEYEAADANQLADLGVSKVVTLTSTYDHRVIQGAESGVFLSRVHDLLLGGDRFYDEVFSSIGVPYTPVRWQRDINPTDRRRGDMLKQAHVQTLINMYRVRGHLIAHLDPLDSRPPRMHPELDPATYGLTIWDLDREFLCDGLAGRDELTLGEILGILRDAYCRTVGVEYMHIQEPDQKRWIQEHVEGVGTAIDPEEQRHILSRLSAAEAFEQFLHSRYIGQKRFGLEGAESAVCLLDAVLDEASEAGTAEAVIGTAHRGRLNFLANIVGKSYQEIFREFEGDLDPESVQGSGDVKYHKGASGKFVGLSGIDLPVTLASNPSHLEAVDPVVEGMARARQDLYPDNGASPVLAMLVHGDAAFAGQGVVAETLNLSALEGYRIGGTVHVVINNQLGFTTGPQEARSSVYPTDVAKMVQAPIFHVNGDDPEACVRVGRLAFAFRQAFHKDVVIDLVCYRRHGHNEGDEPSYTQPQMYERIDAKPSVRELYTRELVRRGDITEEEAEQAQADFAGRLRQALEETRAQAPPRPVELAPPPPQAPVEPPVPTGVSRETLDRLARVLHTPPDGFSVHPKLAQQIQARAQLYAHGEVDWSLAEALAFGSLLLEGTDVRLSGQDTRRGTFSHRHSVLVDYRTENEFVPLAELRPDVSSPDRVGRFFVYDSLLSEYAALGFEYGYSVVRNDALVCWEAQFGDFVNGAQIIIDQFVVAAEDKWGQSSGLVLLLPHGYEGQGPEHSSARPERFLTLAAAGNLTVAQPSTGAQYFHLLRAQVKRAARPRPLVALTPKSLLRARAARSPASDLEHGVFQVVLDDPATSSSGSSVSARTGSDPASSGAMPVLDPSRVERVVLCSGKVAYEAMARRDRRQSGSDEPTAAVVRVEQLYPWPEEQLEVVLARYPSASEVVWLQEEPENMGPWTFVHGRLHRLLRDDYVLRHASRAESASPATGSAAIHQLETDDLLERAFGSLS